MNIFDYFIFIPIIIGLIRGLFKGLIKELFSLLAVLAALLVAELFNSDISPTLANWLSLSPKMATPISYITLFIASLLVFFLILHLIETLINGIHLGWLNKILGAGFGALKIAIIVSVLMNVFDALDSRFNFVDTQKKEASIGYYPILHFTPTLWEEAQKAYNKEIESRTKGEKHHSSIITNDK